MPLNHETLAANLFQALKSCRFDTLAENMPIQHFSQLSGSRAEQVDYLDYLLGSENTVILPKNLRKLFWLKKEGRHQHQELFLHNNPISWLSTLSYEAQGVECKAVVGGIYHLLWSNAAHIQQLIIPPSEYSSAQEDHVVCLFALIERVIDIQQLDEENQVQLFNLYQFHLSRHGVLKIIHRFKDYKLQGDTIIRLLCPVEYEFPLLAEDAFDFFSVLKTAYLEGRLDVEQFIKLRKRWLLINDVSAERVNSLNIEAYKFLREVKRTKPNDFGKLHSVESFFLYPRVLLETGRVKLLKPINLSCANQFYDEYLQFFSTLTLASLVNRRPIAREILLTGLSIMLPNPNSTQVISYLKLLKNFMPQQISYQQIYDLVMQTFAIFDNFENVLATQWQLFLVQEFGGRAEHFITGFLPRQDELCASLVASNNSAEKQQAVLEALTPGTSLYRLFTKDKNINALLDEIRKPHYSGEQLLSLIGNFQLEIADHKSLLSEIKQRVLPRIIECIEKPGNDIWLCYALDPDLPIYSFLALSQLRIKHDTEELNALRKSHPEIILKILIDRTVRENHLEFLLVARQELILYISQLPNNIDKQDLLLSILQGTDTAIFKFFRLKSDKYLHQLIKKNLAVIIELIIRASLNHDTLIELHRNYSDDVINYIKDQSNTSLQYAWLNLATETGNPLNDFFVTQEAAQPSRRRRSSVETLVAVRDRWNRQAPSAPEARGSEEIIAVSPQASGPHQ